MNDTKLAAAAQTEASRLTAGLQQAGVGAALSLLEYRSIKVYRGGATMALAALIAIATGGLFLVADLVPWRTGPHHILHRVSGARRGHRAR